MEEFMTLSDASAYASSIAKKSISISNITYLLQYGRIKKYGTRVSKKEIVEYFNGRKHREKAWKRQLGEDLHWHLSFENFKEKETTKHVHRLHPYKGKFIPQLVAYFLDEHTDECKKDVFFRKGDLVLDPFCGSGTTLVQAKESGLHAIGIDISYFNARIANVKLARYDMPELSRTLHAITTQLSRYTTALGYTSFERELSEALHLFNKKFFPSPEFKVWVNEKKIEEHAYAQEKLAHFIDHHYSPLLAQHRVKINQDKKATFLDTWYLYPIRKEIDFIRREAEKIDDAHIRHMIALILSRTVRSCRATGHADLATLKHPVSQPYYCKKHGKICRPLLSMLSWWKRYSIDAMHRLQAFAALKTDTQQVCVQGDARCLDIRKALRHTGLHAYLEQQKIRGIFTSPPYVGLIDYHEQHAYAYELFGFQRNDEQEIGPLSKGQGKEAQKSYVHGVAEVLRNCKRFLVEDFDIFLVANDKYKLYPIIAREACLRIVNEFRRPVLNRTEKDKAPYAESIFHLKNDKAAT